MTSADRQNDVASEEGIVVLSGHGVAETRLEIEQETEILQSISPRLFVIRLTPGVLDHLSKMQNVVASTSLALPDAAMRGLSAPERQWAAAWNLRRAKKFRLGEGMGWDAPGFLPPDRPE